MSSGKDRRFGRFSPMAIQSFEAPPRSPPANMHDLTVNTGDQPSFMGESGGIVSDDRSEGIPEKIQLTLRLGLKRLDNRTATRQAARLRLPEPKPFRRKFFGVPRSSAPRFLAEKANRGRAVGKPSKKVERDSPNPSALALPVPAP